jgi:hypothetical protein
MWMIMFTLTAIFISASPGWAEDLGNLSANPYDPDSSSNAFGKGSPFAPNGINNPFSPYGSPSAIRRRPIASRPTRPDCMTNRGTIVGN